jgi:hypothetical protein
MSKDIRELLLAFGVIMTILFAFLAGLMILSKWVG